MDETMYLIYAIVNLPNVPIFEAIKPVNWTAEGGNVNVFVKNHAMNA